MCVVTSLWYSVCIASAARPEPFGMGFALLPEMQTLLTFHFSRLRELVRFSEYL